MTQQVDKMEHVNMLNYLTISSLAYNLYLAGSGKNMFQQGEEDLGYNRS
jgi:acyl-CoA thioesterase FadM